MLDQNVVVSLLSSNKYRKSIFFYSLSFSKKLEVNYHNKSNKRQTHSFILLYPPKNPFYSTVLLTNTSATISTVILSSRESLRERTVNNGGFDLSSQASQAISICFVLDMSFVVTLMFTMSPLDAPADVSDMSRLANADEMTISKSSPHLDTLNVKLEPTPLILMNLDGL